MVVFYRLLEVEALEFMVIQQNVEPCFNQDEKLLFALMAEICKD